ncbi:MAG TPA: competence/damage-inducible protein A, partial [Parasegetibacter sp.]
AASIITIGDELLIGQTIDTNSAWMAQELNKIGIWVKRRVAVGDSWNDIRDALNEESKQSQIILITGGLGPTADDITKPLLCEYFGGKMVVNEEKLQHVKYLFEEVLKRPLLERNLKQAEVPDVCKVLLNERGTAPGMVFEKDNRLYISLPGVPYEMKGLMTNDVLPMIQKRFPLLTIIHRNLVTAGIGESFLAEKIQDIEESLPENIKLAYLPNFGMVKLRLTGTGSNREETESAIEKYFLQLKERLRELVVTDQDLPLEQVVLELLKKNNMSLGTAESCTGGYLAHLITSIPGSSVVFRGSVVSYANDVKEKVLGVPDRVLNEHGAVSELTVKAMVNGALEQLRADVVIATTGIMGPGGGTTNKPVGMVWIGVGNKERVSTRLLQLRYDRSTNIQITAANSFNLLRQFILGEA